MKPDLSNPALLTAICKAERLPVPVFEYQFHTKRKWRFDAAYPGNRIAIEFEGGVWRAGGGTHQRPKRFLADMEKYNEAALAGWRVLRVPTHDSAKLIELLHRVFNPKPAKKPVT